jgi:hypothetical protein
MERYGLSSKNSNPLFVSVSISIIDHCNFYSSKEGSHQVGDGSHQELSPPHSSSNQSRLSNFISFFRSGTPKISNHDIFNSALSSNKVVWSHSAMFRVKKDMTKGVARPEITNRGFLIVRLIPSTRGKVLAGIDEAVRHMSLGETSDVKVDSLLRINAMVIIP